MRPLLPLWLLIYLSLIACGEKGSMVDLESELMQIKSRPSGQIEALPEITTYNPSPYTGSGFRSPFRSEEEEQENAAKVANTVHAPDLMRQKSELEQIPFEKLTMVGSIQFYNDKHPSALIDDGQGQVHKVRIGDYLGQDFGQVGHISHTGITLEETIQDELGNWIKRPRQLTLPVEQD